MIEIHHRVTLRAQCPVNGEDDYYNTVVTLSRVVPVEDILYEAKFLTQAPIFQEDLTRELAKAIKGEVVTHGIHSGVYTTCRCDGKKD